MVKRMSLIEEDHSNLWRVKIETFLIKVYSEYKNK